LTGELYSYLEMLDRKLNTIIDILSRKDNVFHSKYVDIDISGAGIKYCSDTKLEEGSYLELRIILPYFPNPRIAALGRVVRSSHQSVEGKDSWETAVSFVSLSEKDRDILISYVFSKEREILRANQKP
jgi:c-di-GMP-binding flagellar brake protein YcgR